MPPTAEYKAPWPVFALAWSNHPSTSSSSSSSYHPRNPSGSARYVPSSPSPLGRQDEFGGPPPSTTPGPPDSARIAVGSFVEQYTNRIQVLGFDQRDSSSLTLLADASHPYPPTKLGFQPSTLFDLSSSERRDASLDRERGSGERGYTSPTTKLAKRGSWGAKLRPSLSGDGGELPDHYPDRELLASTADCLRIWEIYRNDYSDPYQSSYVGGNTAGGAQQGEGSQLPFSLREKSVLAHSKNTKSPPAPLTSFSWNTPSPNLIVTSSIDTTCTIWDLPTRTALTQLIAHDREVYDVDWCPGSADVFASVGADGSVRVFDLRSLEHSTIIYETGTAPGATESRPGTSMSTSSRATSTRSVPAAPLLRIAFNPWDANYLATFHLESDSVQILDVRAPGSPILELRGHSAAVNAIVWGPPSIGAGLLGPSKGMVCSAADDAQVLVYDLASTTLRTASAQGRRSRNGHAPSPAPGSLGYSHSTSSFGGTASPAPTASIAGSIGIGAEIPFLAYTTPNQDMVNNVSWLRAGGGGLPPGVGGFSGGGGSSSNKSVVQEWNEFTAGSTSGGNASSGFAPHDSDWIALAAGNSVRALKV
ncbi:related to human and petunia an11 protein [Sporisorium scitamineum]|uniref:Related to human and petunia an11 protein n=1 Tax=Sporisorium scitamineum TaxID=49012 RepID=A0A0F7S387_9BASI|nr:hypothetical protein [Sporisorium scitamineum]CDU25053.1 related to human and petunia an11 protein [Sporisorium scitamineum]